MTTMKQAPPPRPAIIHRPDLQPTRERVAYQVLTALAWAVWLYLFLPLISLLAWWFGFEMFSRYLLGSEDYSQLATLLRYAGIVIIAAGIIVLWSVYNLQRFGGMDRRKPVAMVTDAQLCERFVVDQARLDLLRAGRRLVLDLDERGKLVEVTEIDDDGRKQLIKHELVITN